MAPATVVTTTGSPKRAPAVLARALMQLFVEVREVRWQWRDRGIASARVALEHAGHQRQAPTVTGGLRPVTVAFPFDPDQELGVLVYDQTEQFVGHASVNVAQMLDDGVAAAAVPIVSPNGLQCYVNLGLGVSGAPQSSGAPLHEESPFAAPRAQFGRVSGSGGGSSNGKPVSAWLLLNTSSDGGGAPHTPAAGAAGLPGVGGFGRRMSRGLLPTWSSNSMRSLGSFKSARTASRDDSEPGGEAPPGGPDLLAGFSSGEGPLTAWRALRSGGGAPGAHQSAVAAQAAAVAAQAHRTDAPEGGPVAAPVAKALSPIPEGPSPDLRPESERGPACSERRAAEAGAAGAAPRVAPGGATQQQLGRVVSPFQAGSEVLLMDSDSIRVLHTGYSSDEEGGDSPRARAERQLLVQLAQQTAQTRADEAALMASLASQIALGRAQEAQLMSSLAEAGSRSTSPSGQAAGPAPQGGGDSEAYAAAQDDWSSTPGMSCTPEFASPYMSAASSAPGSVASSVNSSSGRRTSPAPQAALLVGGAASNPAALRRTALAQGKAALAAAAAAAVLSPSPVEALPARFSSPVQVFKHGYPALEAAGLHDSAASEAACAARRGQQAQPQPRRGPPARRALDAFDGSDGEGASPRRRAAYPVVPAGVAPAYACEAGGRSGLTTRRCTQGCTLGALRGGRFTESLAYAASPYPARGACFPPRSVCDEPTAPALPVCAWS